MTLYLTYIPSMSHKCNNIFLIGPMGCGKSTIGKHIAQLTGLQFYDSDQEIEAQTGVTVSWIFSQEGETGFRRREKDTIARLVGLQHIVLATGGGAIVTPENSILLQQNGVVVRLLVSLDRQIKRIAGHKSKRPLFSANASNEQLTALNTIREPLYAKIADLTYNTDTIAPKDLALQIIADWREFKTNQEV